MRTPVRCNDATLAVLLADLGYVDAFGRRTELSDDELDLLADLEALQRRSNIFHFACGNKWIPDSGARWGRGDLDSEMVHSLIKDNCREVFDSLKRRHTAEYGGHCR